MRLHSIRLQNYRGIVDATVDFADGVTIVEGPNEVGKSSIHEAIAHLREDKSSSKKASVKDTQPIGVDEGPEVSLHLTTGDIELRYAKRWLRGQYTTLEILRPRPEQLSGDEAHERFLSVLADTVDVDLLVALARRPRQVFTREMLLEEVWGYRHQADTRLVNVHVQRLRSKVEPDPENPCVVLTVRGVGYKAGQG